MIYSSPKKRFKDNNDKSKVSEKRYYAVVDNKHRLVYHRDGFIMIFHRRRQAIDWLQDNNLYDQWTVRRVDLCITLV